MSVFPCSKEKKMVQKILNSWYGIADTKRKDFLICQEKCKMPIEIYTCLSGALVKLRCHLAGRHNAIQLQQHDSRQKTMCEHYLFAGGMNVIKYWKGSSWIFSH